MSTDRLLIIDDERDICDFLSDVAEDIGFDVVTVTDADAFWVSFADFAPSVIFLDLQMPHVDGIELLRALTEKGCRAHVAIVSGADVRVVNTAERLGVAQGLRMLGTLYKPVRLRDLRGMLSKARSDERPITEDDRFQAF